MNCDNFGSFSIVCRLAASLRRSASDGAENVRAKCRRTLQAFLEKFSTKPCDLLPLFQLILATDGSHAITAASSERPATAEEQQLASTLLDDCLLDACCGVSAICDVPFTSYGNMSLSEALALVDVLRPVAHGRRRREEVDHNVLRKSISSMTADEWLSIKHISVGNRQAFVGTIVTPSVLLELLSPHAEAVLASTGGDIRAAILAAADGSPRMIRESSTRHVTATDDVDAGFASGGEDGEAHPLAAVAAGLQVNRADERCEEPQRKVARVEPVAPASPSKPPLPSTTPCMYGSECRRKNPEHFLRFSHPVRTPSPTSTVAASAIPASPKANAAINGGGHAAVQTATSTRDLAPAGVVASYTSPAAASAAAPVTHAIKGVLPLRAMKEFEFVPVENSGGGYKMKNCGDGTYTCNCPVWRYQNKATNERTCKHLQAYLGAEFEAARCGGGGGSADSPLIGSSVAGAAARPGSPTSPRKCAMPGVLLANKASNGDDYTGWWISEKLDGVRAYWDGTHLLSRNGNPFTAPESFTAALPREHTLDGELFGGRKKFQSTVGIVKSSASHPGWATLTYEIFDIPSMGDKPFEQRMDVLRKLFPSKACAGPVATEASPPPAGGSVVHVHVVEQEKCTGAQHIADRLAEVEAVGGEGLMLREPGSKYVCSRSNTLLKVKSTEETDAIIRGHDPGKGKHFGRCGALLVELANGKQFCVGSGLTDAQRAAPPSIGTVVVVRYQELTDGGIPRFPVFVGCRYDVDWPPKPKS